MKRRRDAPGLPAWAVVTAKRRAHITRVTKLLEVWARAMRLSARNARAWRDAGRWHDALRDVAPSALGPPRVDPTLPAGAWHGPAAAARLRREGERRKDVLAAIAWHTVGDPAWGPTGRALFCADYLEPGRRFDRDERAALAARFPDNPDAVLREVVRKRLEQATRERRPIHARTLALWEAVR